MKHISTVLSLILVSIVSFGLSAQTVKEEAIAEIDTLNRLIITAEETGIDATKEKATVRTAEVFLEFADWDQANIDVNTSLFAKTHGYKDKPAYWANLVADFEREEVITMLNDAADFLQKLIDGTYTRRPSVKLDWSNISLVDDQLTQGDKPVFLLDYTWKPGIPNLTEYFGNKDGAGLYVGWMKDKTTINSSRLAALRAKEDGRVGFVFIGHQNPPAWTKDAYGDDFRLADLQAMYPDDYSGEVSRYTDFDIDNPGAKELVGNLIDGTVGLMSGKQYTEMGYMLCNEPHFYSNKTNGKIDWGSSHITNYTLEKFKIWLKEKHHTIDVLNQLWGSNFASFNEVEVEVPMDIKLRGTAIWYDWNIFNNYRVTEWYTWMKGKVQENDPFAKVHLKIMPSLWSGNNRGSGIDFESLTELSEIIGNDCGAAYTNVWDWKPIEWDKEYSWDWRELAMSYDFLKSVSPEKSMINSESHFLSTSGSRDLYMKQEYANSTAWLAHLKGLTYEQVWFWNRLEDGSPKTFDHSHAASNNQQPRIINQMTSTYIDLNSFGEEVMKFQRQRKAIRIFYSETSAQNKPDHMDDVFEVYEDLAFEGISLGFATQKIIENQDNANWDVIIVYKTEYVTQDELDALQTYLDNGGTIILDPTSLKKNEYGVGLASLSQSAGKIISPSSMENLKAEALNILEENNNLPEVTLRETHTGLHDGCMWYATKNKAGKHILFISNVGNTEATIKIDLKNATVGTRCKDLLKGIVISSKQKLKPYEMLLLEITDDTDVSVKPYLLSDRKGKVKVSPSPFSNKLNIDTQSLNYDKLRILNLNGQVVEQVNITGKQKISLQADVLGMKPGMYILELSGKNDVQCVKVLKSFN